MVCRRWTMGYGACALGVFVVVALYVSPVHATGFNASNVLGQSNFTSSTAATTQDGMNGPFGSAYDPVNQRLFVAGNGSSRVLVFNVATSTISNGENAAFVLGESNFTSSTFAITQNGMNGPYGSAYDPVNQRLFVLDGSNSVLVFNVATSTISNGENAAFVLGQSNFTSNTATTTQNGMNNPIGASYDPVNQRLFVVDQNNSRVLVFNVATSTISFVVISDVLHSHKNFTSSTSAITQNGMNGPYGSAYDPVNQRLFVFSGYSGHRVLVFNVATSTISNGENAAFVLGESNFTSSTSAITQNGMNAPIGAAYDPVNQRLFVLDGSSRVLVFNVATSTISNGEDAEFVLGQSDFTSDGFSFTAAQNNLNSNGGVSYDPVTQRLFVSDFARNRVLVFNFASLTSSSFNSGVAGSSYDASISTAFTQGTVSLATTTGDLPPGLALGTSTIFGTPTATGTYAFSLQASDDNGSIGVLASNPVSYAIEINPAAPAVFSKVATSSITSSTAVISWATDVSSLGTVYYGTTNAYGSSVAETASSTSHSVTLANLAPNTAYHFEVAADHLGTVSTSTDYNFTTAQGTVVVVSVPGTGLATTGGAPIESQNPTSTGSSSTSTPASPSTASLVMPSLQAELASLEAQVQSLLKQASSLPSSFSFSRNLSLLMTGNDVQALQVFLNTHGYPVTSSGNGSLHRETFTFGDHTYAALVRYQRDHNIPATGFFGPLTRAAVETGA